MYSLFSKKESAHEDAIWCVDWKRRPEKEEVIDKEQPEGENQEDGDQQPQPKETRKYPQVDVIATGGVDDVVKVGSTAGSKNWTQFW